MRIYLLSPYHGGSHQAWAEGYQRHSRHHIELITMPARFWKWRMHGGAITLARDFQSRGAATDRDDAILLATDMLDLTTFLALTRVESVAMPVALYMHENQLTYPLPEHDRRSGRRRQMREADRHYAFINLASMLAADHVFFNSEFHRTSLLNALPGLLNHFPEFNELETVETVRAKSSVLPVGVSFDRLDPPPVATSAKDDSPLVLWNQRWEYDKNPEAFLRVLHELAEEGFAFRVALCGERFGIHAPAFEKAAERLGDRIVQFGYADDERYRQLLWEATVTFSTARHEFFGISILEAAYAHTLPILPRRLSYPELIPPTFHGECLYDRRSGMLARLRAALTQPERARKTAGELARAIVRFEWSEMAPIYDQRLLDLRHDLAPR